MKLEGENGNPNSEPSASEFGRSWTLPAAIERALSLNPDIQRAEASMNRQRGIRVQVRSDLLPSMTLTGSANGRDEGLIDRNPNGFNQVPSDQTAITQDSYIGSIEFRQIIFDGLKRWNRYKQETLRLKGERSTVEDTQRRIASFVKQSFDQLLFMSSVVEIRKETVSTFETILDITQKKLSAGDVTEYESLRVRTELQSAIAELAEAETNLIKAEQIFRSLLVLPQPVDSQDERIKLAGKLEEVPFDKSFGKALGLALDNREDLRAARYRWEAEKKGVHAAHGEWLPMLEVFANYSLRSSYFDDNTELEGWTIGAVGHWNIFDGFQRSGAIVSEKAEARAAQITYQELEYKITSQLQELYAQIAQSRSVIKYHRASMDLGSESLHQAERLYEVGQVGLEIVLDAQITLRHSQINFSRALFNYNSALAQIEYAIATPLNGEEEQ